MTGLRILAALAIADSSLCPPSRRTLESRSIRRSTQPCTQVMGRWLHRRDRYPGCHSQGHRHPDGEPDRRRRASTPRLTCSSPRTRRRWRWSSRPVSSRRSLPKPSPMVPEEFRPASGMWTGIAARRTSSSTTRRCWPRPTSPSRCSTSPAPNGQAAGARRPPAPISRPSSRPLLQLKGSDETANWLAGLQARTPSVYRGNFEAMRGANMGEVGRGPHLQLLLFRRQGWAPGKLEQRSSTLFFGDRGSRWLRLDLGRWRAEGLRQSRSRAGVPRLRYRARRVRRSSATATAYEYTIGSGVEANPVTAAARRRSTTPVDPSLLNAQEVVQLMTAAGVM